MTCRPTVSVVLSAYNAQEYLHLAIESILNQTYADLELIVINDGSTDDTADIIEKYCALDSRVRCVRHENQGLTKSLNKGISIARGRYIARQDSDDISLSRRLEKQIAVLESDPDIFLVGTNYREIDVRSGNVLKLKVPFCEDDEEIRRNISCFNPFCHTSVLFKNDIAKIAYFYDEAFTYAQDYELWVRILKHYKARNLREVLVERRNCPQMISRAKQRQQRYFALKAKMRGFSLCQNYLQTFKNICKDIIVIVLPKATMKFLKKIRFF